MQEQQMLFPVSQVEFWKQMRMVIEEVVDAKMNSTQTPEQSVAVLPDKTLLKVSEVCALFQVSKPTLYEWIREGRVKSFKVRSRRYFSRGDIEAIIWEGRK
ncbi:MAG: helix-turn-helix domain-containing protein [Chitinophagaceae bacterium]|nr:helix-turn-helix domain-containing protein [Chitinophagaceae bacterium]